MNQAWPVVNLGEVVHHRKEFITIDDLSSYRRPRVQLHAKGIVLRDEVPGALIKTKQQQVCQAGELLVAEIDAKVGGFGIVPDLLNEAIVSSHYFLFSIDEAKLDRRYLYYFIRTPAFRDQVEAQGSTNYAAIRPAHVLGYMLPLPPLAEQRRVVARIEELAGKIGEARGLRQQAVATTGALCVSSLTYTLSHSGVVVVRDPLPEQDQLVRRGALPPANPNAIAARWQVPTGWRAISIAELLMRGLLLDVKDGNHGANHPRSSEFVEHGTPFLMASDLRDGKVLWNSASRLGPDTISRLRVGFALRGDVLFTHKASIGKTAIADRDCILSPQVTYYRCNETYIDPRWLRAFLGSPLFLLQLTAIKSQTTRDFVSIGKQYQQFILLPPIAEQQRIAGELDSVQAQVDTLKGLQGETATDLDALLPAILDRAFKGELV